MLVSTIEFIGQEGGYSYLSKESLRNQIVLIQPVYHGVGIFCHRGCIDHHLIPLTNLFGRLVSGNDIKYSIIRNLLSLKKSLHVVVCRLHR